MNQSSHYKYTPLEVVHRTIHANINNTEQLTRCLYRQPASTVDSLNSNQKYLINAGYYYLSQHSDMQQNNIKHKARKNTQTNYPHSGIVALDVYHELYKEAFRYLYSYTIQKEALSLFLRQTIKETAEVGKILKTMKHRSTADLAGYMHHIDITSYNIKQHIAGHIKTYNIAMSRPHMLSCIIRHIPNHLDIPARESYDNILRLLSMCLDETDLIKITEAATEDYVNMNNNHASIPQYNEPSRSFSDRHKTPERTLSDYLDYDTDVSSDYYAFLRSLGVDDIKTIWGTSRIDMGGTRHKNEPKDSDLDTYNNGTATKT